MTPTLGRILVDLTPLLPGGANGGAKPLARSLVSELSQTIAGQAPREQVDIAIEIEGLQILIEQWRIKGRPALAHAAA